MSKKTIVYCHIDQEVFNSLTRRENFIKYKHFDKWVYDKYDVYSDVKRVLDDWGLELVNCEKDEHGNLSIEWKDKE